MAFIAPEQTDRELENIIRKTKEKSDLSNLPTVTLDSGLVVTKPYINLLQKVMSQLDLVFGYVNMTREYDYRPDYVSYDYYGTTNLYWFVLYTNKVKTCLDFTHNRLDKIKLYRSEDVTAIINSIMKR